MVRSKIFLWLAAGTLLFAACATAPEEAPPARALLATPTAALSQEPLSTPRASGTVSFPTETPLPTLVLPTRRADEPAALFWDGMPTYPGDSQPEMFFRLEYDPSVWGLTKNVAGEKALAHRSIPNCIISPASGRGLPYNLTSQHQMRALGNITYDAALVSENGTPKFALYLGGDEAMQIYTGFQVSFGDESEACLQDAEKVLATLTAIPKSEAKP